MVAARRLEFLLIRMSEGIKAHRGPEYRRARVEYSRKKVRFKRRLERVVATPSNKPLEGAVVKRSSILQQKLREWQ